MSRPNILVVILDATRADVCSCYGEEQGTTPALDELAAEGILFEQAISPAPWTLPSMASMFTGLFPSQLDIYGQRVLGSSYPTLAQLLSQSGYATFAITNNSWLSTDFGLVRGFDTVHRQWQGWQTQHEVNKLVLMERSQDSSWTKRMMRDLNQGNLLKNIVNAAYNRLWAYRRDMGASRILRPLRRWIDSQPGPWFVMVHYLEAHLVYRPPLKWTARFADNLDQARRWRQADQWRAAWRHIAGEELLSEADLAVWRDLYRAEVAYADHHLGLLVDWLQRSGRLGNTVVIVVADHGENLGEHGLLNHQYCVYDTLLRVPLIIRYPALLSRGQRIARQVQTSDLFQTVLDLTGTPATPSASQSLLSEQEQRSFTVAEYGTPRLPHPSDLARYGLKKEHLDRFARGLVTIRSESHKLIVGTDGSLELYAWRKDPGEEHNLAAAKPEVVRELQAKLQKWQGELATIPTGETDEEWEMDPTTAARLRALGYIE